MNVLDDPSVPFVRTIHDFDHIVSTDGVPLRIDRCDLVLLISLIELLIDVCGLDTYYLSLIIDQSHVVLSSRDSSSEGPVNLQNNTYVFILIECNHIAGFILDASLSLTEKQGCATSEA